MHALAAGVAAVLAAVALAPHGGTAAGGCRADARAAVAATRPTLRLLADPQRIHPSDVDQALCADFDGDGRSDAAITIASGGTAGDIGYAAFVRTPRGWRIVLGGNGYKLGLFRLGRDLAVSQPVYRKNDPNCCPTGGFDHVRYRFAGSRFVVARRYHTGSYKP